jgi:UDP-N-acetylenolpyruvoylglucosamine reductase
VFRGEAKPDAEIADMMDASKEKRRSSQPVAASAGCIFKNPEGIGAGQLVDELGLKDSGFGNARVSDVHGNFIVNDGAATACDVLDLIAKIKEEARRERGIELDTEVQIIGQDDPI